MFFYFNGNNPTGAARTIQVSGYPQRAVKTGQFSFYADEREVAGLQAQLDGLSQLGLTYGVSQVDPANMPVVMQAFSPLVVMDGSATQIVPPGSGDVVLAIAPTGHLEGVHKTIIIPPGNANSFNSPADLNVTGASFTTDKTYILDIVYHAGFFSATSVSYNARNAVAPTITSATVYDSNPDAIVILFSEAVWVSSVVGLSLTGTTVRVLGVEGGNGTTSVTLTLSGNVAVGQTIQLVVTNAGIADLDGVVLANTTKTVVLAIAPSFFSEAIGWWRGDNVVVVSGAVSQWTDKSSNGNHLTQGTPGNRAAYVSSDPDVIQPAADFNGADHYYQNTAVLVGGVVPIDYTTGYTVIVVGKMKANSDSVMFEANAGSADATGPELYHQASDDSMRYRVSGAAIAIKVLGDSNWHWFAGVHSDAGRDVYIDGVAGSSGGAANPAAIRRFSMGRFDFLGTFLMDGRIAEALIIPRNLSVGELAAVDAYVLARYGV